jgi:hypothetical protein
VPLPRLLLYEVWGHDTKACTDATGVPWWYSVGFREDLKTFIGMRGHIYTPITLIALKTNRKTLLPKHSAVVAKGVSLTTTAAVALVTE